MAIFTRLDGRSENNSTLYIKDRYGDIVAEISVEDYDSVTLQVSTDEGLHLEKDNGWSSEVTFRSRHEDY